MKAAKGLAPKVIARMNSEKPMELEYRIAEEGRNSVRYWIAPLEMK